MIAAYFSARWGVKNALRSKWWDKKERAYEAIIDALYLGLRYYEEAEEEMYNPEKDTVDLWKQAKSAYAAIERVSTIGEFHICKKASVLLNQFNKRKKPFINRDGSNKDECIDEAIQAYRETLEKFRQLALHDLGVR